MSDLHYFSMSDFNDIKSYNNNNLILNSTERNADVHLNITYTAFEILVGIIAVIGNLMVIIVFKRDRKLRRRTNYYIVSLAVADFLVGLFGIPFAILTSIGQPEQKHACLLSLSILIILCTTSIFCLVAVSVDRYWAILYPMAYSRTVRTKTAIGMISICWVAGTIFGLIPLFGVHEKYEDTCFFEKVMNHKYLVFLYFATIITPALLLLAFYAHIYRVIVRQIRQIVTMNPIGDCSRKSSSTGHSVNTISAIRNHGGMLRVLGAARKRDVKATQNLSIIVLFFMFCWIPLYTINCITAFNPSIPISDEIKMCCIIITHLNSAVNPILYAYHLKDFRAALKSLLFKIFGFENDPPQEIAYRLSLASQHRLQSINNIDKRSSIQNRIYVDSPVWLRQQQQIQINSNSTITTTLNSVHHTVAAVATATADIDRDIWKIVEVSSGSHGNLNIIPDSYRKNNQTEDDFQFSYENKNFPSVLNLNNYDDDVFVSNDNKTTKKSLSLLIREKLSSNDEDYYEINTLNLKDGQNNERYTSISSEFEQNSNENGTALENDCTDRINNEINKYINNKKENCNNLFQFKNSIYHIETDSTQLQESKCKIIKSPTNSTKINFNKFHNKSISCNNNISELAIQKQDDYIFKNFDKLNSKRIINNLVYSKKNYSNSLYHIYDIAKENDFNNIEKPRKRTTSAES